MIESCEKAPIEFFTGMRLVWRKSGLIGMGFLAVIPIILCSWFQLGSLKNSTLGIQSRNLYRIKSQYPSLPDGVTIYVICSGNRYAPGLFWSDPNRRVGAESKQKLHQNQSFPNVMLRALYPGTRIRYIEISDSADCHHEPCLVFDSHGEELPRDPDPHAMPF